MTSPYGGYPNTAYSPGYDQQQAAAMYEQTGRFNQQELDQKYKLGKADISARLKMAGQESKDRRYGIEQQRDSEREKLAYAREEMERLGIPRMLIEKYIAEKNYEIAQAEMSLKRDVFVEETQQARAKIQLDREQMERIGIPAMEIDRYVAQENAKIAQAQQTGYYGGQSTLAREQFASDAEYRQAQAAESRRQFDVGATGYMQGPGGGPGQATLERERFGADEAERQRVEGERQRRYGLDVAQFGAELASTPDTYFQARRFQGVDVPRLLGGAGAATTDAAGGPTPGVATMGAYLGGYDPYGQPPQGYPEAAGGAPTAGPGAPPAGAPPVAGGGGLSPAEQSRYTQLVARQQQLAAAGEPGLAPEDVAELQRYVARGAAAPGAAPGAPGAAPLSAQEQARWQQLMARDQEIRASGGPGLEGVDLDEARRFQARGATYAGPTAGGGPMPTYEPSPRGGGIAGGYGGQPGAPGTTTSYDDGSMASGGYFGPGAAFGGGGYGGAGKPQIEQVRYGSQGPDTQDALGAGGGYEELMGQPSPRGGGIGVDYGATPYGGSSVTASSGYSSAMPSWYTQQYGGGGGGGSPYPSQDPRQKQVAALAKAMPPSPWDGLNEQDSAALTAMASIYKAGGQSMAGGEYERLKSSGRLGFMQSAGKLLGYSPSDLESQYKAYRPSQGSSRMAG